MFPLTYSYTVFFKRYMLCTQKRQISLCAFLSISSPFPFPLHFHSIFHSHFLSFSHSHPIPIHGYFDSWTDTGKCPIHSKPLRIVDQACLLLFITNSPYWHTPRQIGKPHWLTLATSGRIFCFSQHGCEVVDCLCMSWGRCLKKHWKS